MATLTNKYGDPNSLATSIARNIWDFRHQREWGFHQRECSYPRDGDSHGLDMLGCWICRAHLTALSTSHSLKSFQNGGFPCLFVPIFPMLFLILPAQATDLKFGAHEVWMEVSYEL